jgi:AcrR family transcriptional regulator
MVRVVKTHQERKNELLDTAQMLFYKNGYESTSVADVIDAVNIAKGTFYHYFKSKRDLLDQIIDRIAQNIDAIIDKVLHEPEENAIVELNNIYQEIGEYKVQEKKVLIMMTRALYNDNNIILRTKLTRKRIDIVAPRLSKVITRGISEKLFNTGDPDHVSELILNMGTPLAEKFAEYVLNDQLNQETMNEYLSFCKSYEKAVEKVLGAPEDSLNIFDLEIIKAFFTD